MSKPRLHFASLVRLVVAAGWASTRLHGTAKGYFLVRLLLYENDCECPFPNPVLCITVIATAQQTRTEDGVEPAGTNYSIGHVGLHAMPYNNDLVSHHFHNGVIESLDVHVDPPSLYKAQLAVRQGRRLEWNGSDGTVDPLAFARL